MKKRLFFAIPITKGLYPKIGRLEDEIEKKFKVNWIPLQNLHLTILFLGNIDINYLPKIFEIIDRAYIENKEIFRPLNLRVKKIDYGPPGKKRMIWLYIEKNEKLKLIKNILEEYLQIEKIPYQKEEREFLPHINLARLKNFKDLPEIKKDLNWAIILNELNLYESYLEKPFARYEILKSIKLTI
jgi:2'-5' RNA ligase